MENREKTVLEVGRWVDRLLSQSEPFLVGLRKGRERKRGRKEGRTRQFEGNRG